MHLLLLAAQLREGSEQLRVGDILLILAVIAAAVFFVVLAGFGYFSPGDNDKP